MNSTLKCLGFLLCTLLSLVPAEAQITDTWTGAAGDGQWSTANNWRAGVAPGINDEAWIASTSTITLPGSATTIFALVIDNAPVTLDATASSFTTTHLGIGGIGNVADLTLNIQSGGQFVITGDENFVGDTDFFGSPSTGTLNVGGNGTLALTDTDVSLAVGAGVLGVMNQTGGTVAISGTITVGSDSDAFTTTPSTGTGVYNLSGTSTLTINGEMDLGASSASSAPTSTGSLNITGGLVNGTGTIDLGTSESSGSVKGDTGVITQSAGTLAVDTLNVGEATGGFGSYSLSGTGTFSLSTLNLGDQTGASGTLTQIAGTGTITTAMNVGENGTGSYSISGGTLTIADGAALNVGDQSGSAGTVTQTGGLVTGAGTANVNVSNGGSGLYTLSGGTLTLTAGLLNIGTASGSGTFTLSGSGDLIVPGGVNIGGIGGGTGVFNDNGGTIDSTTDIALGANATFNQTANFAPIAAQFSMTTGSTYNLISGTLTIGNDMGMPGLSGISASGGTFNFAGGTVAVTGAPWTDPLSGSISANSTIDTTGGDATLTGTLIGSAVLTVTGGNTVDLTGISTTNASTWGINVTGNSTVDADASTFPASGGIAIGGGSTVNMAENGTNTLSGALSGSGAFDVTFGANNDLLALNGNSTFAGTTNLSGSGTLELLNGSYGNITGAGNVTFGDGTDAASVNLTGANNTYTGATLINPNATVTASNFKGAGVVTNNGTLSVTNNGSGVGTLNIGGSLVSDGTINIHTNGVAADEIIVATTANVTNTTFSLVNPAGTGTFTIISTGGAGDLTATTHQISANQVLQATIEPDGTNHDLLLVTNVQTISAIPGLLPQLTPNEASVQQNLDQTLANRATLNPTQLQNFFLLLDATLPNGASNAQLAQNLEQLTPQSLQYAPTIAYENATFLAQNVDGFANNLHHGFAGFDTSAVNIYGPGFNSGLGRQMQSMLAYDPPAFHQAAPNGTNYYPGGQSSGAVMDDDTVGSSSPVSSSSQTVSDTPIPLRTSFASAPLRQDSNFSEFIGGEGSIANLNQDSGASNAPSTKASYTAADVIAGISYKMTSNLSAGILFDYNHTDAKTDGYGSRTKVDSYSPGLFATYGDKGFFVNGLFSFGENSYSNNRQIPAIGAAATSHPSGQQYVGDLDAGYEFHPLKGLTVTPTGGLTYTHLDIDSFTESGAELANLSVQSQSDDSLRSRLGGYVTYELHQGQLTFVPMFMAMWQHEFLDQDNPITSQFVQYPLGSFTINSVSQGRDSALVGIGVTATLDNNMAIFVNCTADANGSYNAENFIGGFKGSF